MHGWNHRGDVKIAASGVFYLGGPNSAMWTCSEVQDLLRFLGVRASEQVAHDFDLVPLMMVIV